MPPIPNTLFQRDPSCWIYSGVTCNPMYWPARKPETLLQRAIYKFHPKFKRGDFKIWWGDSDEDFGNASMEGGDVMPVGNGVVLIGMGERTTHQAVGQVARRAVSHQGGDARDRLPYAQEPCCHASRHGVQLLRSRSRRPFSTTLSIRSAATASIRKMVTVSSKLSVRESRCWKWSASALGLNKLVLVGLAATAYEAEREQWDDGNNVVALEPGVVVAYDRNTLHQHASSQGRRGGDHDQRVGTRPRARRWPLHDVPDLARPRLLTNNDHTIVLGAIP